jgi:hypothetical protein
MERIIEIPKGIDCAPEWGGSCFFFLFDGYGEHQCLLTEDYVIHKTKCSSCPGAGKYKMILEKCENGKNG